MGNQAHLNHILKIIIVLFLTHKQIWSRAVEVDSYSKFLAFIVLKIRNKTLKMDAIKLNILLPCFFCTFFGLHIYCIFRLRFVSWSVFRFG